MGRPHPAAPQSYLWHCGRPTGSGYGLWHGHA
nr:MAG TPA: hypothetical protein [Caudoviricetes sp.]